jgi:hypothetical protein
MLKSQLSSQQRKLQLEEEKLLERIREQEEKVREEQRKRETALAEEIRQRDKLLLEARDKLEVRRDCRVV